jgi:hypothetical protein
MKFSLVNGESFIGFLFCSIIYYLGIIIEGCNHEKYCASMKEKLPNLLNDDIKIGEFLNRFSELASYEIFLIYKRFMLRNSRHILSACG